MIEEPYCSLYGDYRGCGPVFFSREECPWLTELEHQWRAIRMEYEAYYFRQQNRLPLMYVPDVELRGLRTINFVTSLNWYMDTCAQFPETMTLLRSIPHLTSAFVNLLQPRSEVPAHNGETNAVYRCHLGLIVPGEVDQCGFDIGGQRTGWREGEAFAFDDAYRHHSWNHTDSDRVVLVFDVMKPQYQTRKLTICGDVLGAFTLRMLETKFSPLRSLPPRARRVMHRLLSRAASVLLYIRGADRYAA